MRIGAFNIFSRNSDNSWTIIALHWKWSITWRFFLHWSKCNGVKWDKKYAHFKTNGGRLIRLTLPLRLGTFNFQTQQNMRQS